MDKLKMHTPDKSQMNIAKIAEFFPNCIAESKSEGGILKQSIDFDLLKQELSDVIVDGPQERYHLNWPGKREALIAANAPIAKTLRPYREESVNFDTTRNLFIEGDNLEALKMLQETYLNRIKVIYIDPPYNTGKDFVYEDDFSEQSSNYLSRSNQQDVNGKRMVANLESNGRFHSDWLSMIYPRLKLARSLLKDDGALFVSIDDGEVANLRKVCDEVFGEDNFLANVVWQKKYAVSNDDPGIAPMHDHILVYRKSESFARGLLPRTDKQLTRYKNEDNDPRGPWASGEYVSSKSKSERPTLWYSISHPVTGKDVWPDENAVWRYSKEKHLQLEVEGRLYWGPTLNYERPRLKRYLTEIQDGVVPSTWWEFTEVGHNDEGQKETAKLLGRKIFSTPKPVRLIKRMIHLASNDDDICLDFFSGSSATAQAVLELNAEDGGKRSFIMIQIGELCDEKSEAFQEGYRTIADIGKERIRRAGEKIRVENATTNPQLDVGFRVLKVDSSNMKDVYYQPDDTKQSDLFSLVENIKEERTSEDLLFQVLLDWGVDVTLKIFHESIGGTKVFFVDGNALAACFEKELSEGTIVGIASRKPVRAVFRDRSFTNDSAKINIEQIFKYHSPGTDLKCI